MTHTCVGNLAIIGSDNGLSPGWHQAIILTNAEILIFRTLGTNFNDIFIEIHTFSFKRINLEMSSLEMAAILSRPQCVNKTQMKFQVAPVAQDEHLQKNYRLRKEMHHSYQPASPCGDVAHLTKICFMDICRTLLWLIEKLKFNWNIKV